MNCENRMLFDNRAREKLAILLLVLLLEVLQLYTGMRSKDPANPEKD